MRRLALTLAVLAVALPAQAAERPLREFVMPPGRMDGDPVPKAVPRARVQAALPVQTAAEDQPFVLACTAAEAALTKVEPGRQDAPPRCAGEPFTVLAERP